MLDLSKTVIGMEFGSTRIKSVLMDESHRVLASGNHEWENRLENGIWTYSMDDIISGMQQCFADLKADVRLKFGVALNRTGVIGISAMMHGYLPTDVNGQPLTAFRTWRNTITGQAADRLTELFQFNIPQRWSIAHLYQAILNGEAHVAQIHHLNTLAVYIHQRLTGRFAAGMDEASGIFPLDSETHTYSARMLDDFNELISQYHYSWRLEDLLPEILHAGKEAGHLTKEGALLLDPSGELEAGIPFAPPEGDAGTGMVATNAVQPRTGNVSAGTSDFAMIVLDHPIGMHREIDIVATPAGDAVAMVHCNNCTSEINEWAGVFGEFADAAGFHMEPNALYSLLFRAATDGEPDAGGLMGFNYLSGEHITGFSEGRPLIVRTPHSRLSLSNLMRAQLMSALATLKIGLDILTVQEKVPIDRLCAHGGFFKTPEVGQRILSAAVNAPVTVMDNAGEGGPYGMALLCAYMLWHTEGESLSGYLQKRVFMNTTGTVLMADTADVQGFNAFADRYRKALPIQTAAVQALKEE